MKLPTYHPEFAEFFQSVSLSDFFENGDGISLNLRHCTLYEKKDNIIVPRYVIKGLLRTQVSNVKAWSYLDVYRGRQNPRGVCLIQEQFDCVYLLYFNQITGTDIYGVADNW